MTLRVLIIEDAPIIRENLMAYLEDESRSVETADSAAYSLPTTPRALGLDCDRPLHHMGLLAAPAPARVLR